MQTKMKELNELSEQFKDLIIEKEKVTGANGAADDPDVKSFCMLIKSCQSLMLNGVLVVTSTRLAKVSIRITRLQYLRTFGSALT